MFKSGSDCSLVSRVFRRCALMRCQELATNLGLTVIACDRYEFLVDPIGSRRRVQLHMTQWTYTGRRWLQRVSSASHRRRCERTRAWRELTIVDRPVPSRVSSRLVAQPERIERSRVRVFAVPLEVAPIPAPDVFVCERSADVPADHTVSHLPVTRGNR